MSGTFQHRVNRLWDSGLQADMAVPAFFWEWLNFVNNHTGLAFVGYGTGKTQSGTTPPAGWFSFDPAVDSNPYGDNSWFVFEAVNADNLLNGGGSNPWQAKIQMTTTTGFDDCNVADTDYGQEAQTWCVCCRCSAAAGWNGTSLDFAPTGGEDASNNARMMNGQSVNYILDIVGDDDTLFWDGACFSGAISNADARSRGGYLGMVNRQSSSIAYPFLSSIGRMHDGGQAIEDAAINRCNNDPDAQWIKPTGTTDLIPGYLRWPSYSLWSDGTKVEGSNIHAHDCWHPSDMVHMTPDPATGKEFIPACLVSQWEPPNKYAIMGEFRLIGSAGYNYDHGVVIGALGDWRQFCYNAVSDSGMFMKWPAGVVPVWT